MKGQAIIDFDTETGEYEVQFKNISDPGKGIDTAIFQRIVQRVVGDWTGGSFLPGFLMDTSRKGN